MAFTPNSLGLIIFSTSIMLNPLVSISLSVAISSVLAGIKKLLIEKLLNKKSESKSSEPKLKLTLTFYIAVLLLIQIYLSHSWDTVRESAIGELGNDTSLVVMNSYENFLEFNQCGCKRNDGNFCHLPNRSRPERNIEDILNTKLLAAFNIELPMILIGFLILILICAVVELCVTEQIPMHTFVLGPQLKNNDKTTNSQDESEIANANEKKPKSRRSKSPSCVVLTLCFVSSITFFVTIFITPISFKDVYVLDQLYCKDGYYDLDNSSARLFNCSGEFFFSRESLVFHTPVGFCLLFSSAR